MYPYAGGEYRCSCGAMYISVWGSALLVSDIRALPEPQGVKRATVCRASRFFLCFEGFFKRTSEWIEAHLFNQLAFL